MMDESTDDSSDDSNDWSNGEFMENVMMFDMGDFTVHPHRRNMMIPMMTSFWPNMMLRMMVMMRMIAHFLPLE
jgi:hypothetical protein